MIEKRRTQNYLASKSVSSLGLAAALGLALAPWLTASNAEAQTAGQESVESGRMTEANSVTDGKETAANAVSSRRGCSRLSP